MAKLKVLICDDRKSEVTQAVRDAKFGARSGVQIDALSGRELAAAIRQVSDAARSPTSNHIRTQFDSYDIVFCDDNLSHLDELGVVITAESIIGNIRAFSKCGYIVSLNKRPEVDFDLESLFGDPSSVADLAINKKHLRIPELWDGSPGRSSSFIPWYWPCLKTAAKMRRAQISEIEHNLDKKILGHFRFTKAAKAALSDRAIGSITLVGQRKGKDTSSQVTFRSFFKDAAKTLPRDDRNRLLHKRRTNIIARVVASELETWLRRDVLAPQNVLVDIPHLLVRMPFLLGKDARKETNWNHVLKVTWEPLGIVPTLYNRHLKAHRLRLSNWLEKPAFWWPDIKADVSLGEWFISSTKAPWGDFVFCEDTRRFRGRLAPVGEKEPQEFTSGVNGPWERRYVERLPRFQYAPATFFAR